MDTEFLDYLLSEKMDVHLYVGQYKIDPGKAKKWDIYGDICMRKAPIKKGVSSEKLILFIQKINKNE